MCRTFPFLSLLLLWGFHFGDPAFWPLRGLMLLFFFPPPLPLLTSPLGFTMFVYLIHRLGTNTSTLRPLPPDALIPRLFQIENGLQGLSRKSLCLNLYEWEPCEPFLGTAKVEYRCKTKTSSMQIYLLLMDDAGWVTFMQIVVLIPASLRFWPFSTSQFLSCRYVYFFFFFSLFQTSIKHNHVNHVWNAHSYKRTGIQTTSSEGVTCCP